MKARILFAVALSAVSLPAFADETKLIGRWVYTETDDAFSDTNQKNVALASQWEGSAVGIRCMGGKPDIMIMTSSVHSDTGHVYPMQFRADKNGIIGGFGQVSTGDVILAIPISPQILFQQILHGKKLAVRIQDDTQGATISFSLAGIEKVRDLFPKECLTVPKDDAESPPADTPSDDTAAKP